MKLVTFDYDRVGYLDGEEIVVLDAPSMRELFEAGRVSHVFYPVFPPDRNAADVIDWLRAGDAA